MDFSPQGGTEVRSSFSILGQAPRFGNSVGLEHSLIFFENILNMKQKLIRRWTRFWMKYANLSPWGRFSVRMAVLFAPPYKARYYLSKLNKVGYISHYAEVFHAGLIMGKRLFTSYISRPQKAVF